jgi:hypothetical protein
MHSFVFVQCCVLVICEVVIILFYPQLLLAALYGSSNIPYLEENIFYIRHCLVFAYRHVPFQ